MILFWIIYAAVFIPLLGISLWVLIGQTKTSRLSYVKGPLWGKKPGWDVNDLEYYGRDAIWKHAFLWPLAQKGCRLDTSTPHAGHWCRWVEYA